MHYNLLLLQFLQFVFLVDRGRHDQRKILTLQNGTKKSFLPKCSLRCVTEFAFLSSIGTPFTTSALQHTSSNCRRLWTTERMVSFDNARRFVPTWKYCCANLDELLTLFTEVLCWRKLLLCAVMDNGEISTWRSSREMESWGICSFKTWLNLSFLLKFF